MCVQPADFIASLSKPRKVIILVMAGKPVDDTIELLSALMEVNVHAVVVVQSLVDGVLWCCGTVVYSLEM